MSEDCNCNDCSNEILTSDFIPLGNIDEGYSGIICFKVYATEDCESNEECVTVVIPPKPAPVIEFLTEYAYEFEGDPAMPVTGINFTVIRSGWTKNRTSTVDWRVVPTGTNPVNSTDFFGYSLPSGTVTFESLEDKKNIEILVNGDYDIENNEQFAVELYNPSGSPSVAVLGNTIVSLGEILKDKPKLNFLSNISKSESSSTDGSISNNIFTFDVMKVGILYKNCFVDWALSPTGSNPIDINDIEYISYPTGTLEFAPGEIIKSIQIEIKDDADIEPGETFALALSNPKYAELGDVYTATGLILDNDDPALSNFIGHANSSPISVLEGSIVSGVTNFEFPIIRTSTTSILPEIELSWITTNVTSSNNDFLSGILPTGTIIFAENQTSGNIVIPISHDTTIESSESFSVILTNSTNSTISNSIRIGQIINDDNPPPPPPPIVASCNLTPNLIIESFDISGATVVGIYDSVGERVGRPQNTGLPTNHQQNLYPCGAATHVCDGAKFDVYINDQMVGVIDLNNGTMGSKPSPSDPYYDSQMTLSFDRQSSFVIPQLPVETISSDGLYTIKLVCKTTWCHYGITFLKIYDKNDNLVLCQCVPLDALHKVRLFTAY